MVHFFEDSKCKLTMRITKLYLTTECPFSKLSSKQLKAGAIAGSQRG